MIRLCSQPEADQAQNVDTEVSATSTIRDFIKALKESKQPLKILLIFFLLIVSKHVNLGYG